METGYPNGRLYIGGFGASARRALVEPAFVAVARGPAAEGRHSGHRLKQVLSYIEDKPRPKDLSLEKHRRGCGPQRNPISRPRFELR